MEQTKKIIIDQLKAGEERAYRFLFDRYFALMCYVAEGYVGDGFLAETIVSDVILHLWENRTSLKIESSLRNYLARSVRNRCLDYLKAEGRRHEQTMSQQSIMFSPVTRYLQSDDHPLGKLVMEDLEEVIKQAIAKLPDSCRHIFELSRFEGKSNDDIAQELGISVITVRYHLRHALSLLKESLGKYLIGIIFLHMFG